ncbi:MAG: GNAT family N-acetyltransferase [Pseudotabrizicola sp.]|uniref:GNAT family N-acetyltransferase n=1 Tax=Pseudotabrizicola sp. TaxID=2939647 RepID=UPI00271E0069|nr:GNAT family N-acetyltransferase [Pseudotabrizicola sp.]MDO8884935.1 GNAT family N-acetyltransferase [Pseudotabrizicola sp.]MDP2081376.1 GNAT family N-acetyltransferase [Pseudotabrizicola sp.]MDZ7575261.1 GNAT family N-acetyltransferase [Pseudotabrizicola sp.]
MGQAAGIWLQTARLRLRPLTLADEAGVIEGLNNPEIASWLATTPYPYPATDFRAYVATAPEGETFSIHDSTGFAGLIGGGAELGFWIARRAQGRGYAVEAAVGLLQAVFEFYQGPVRSGYFMGNIPSAKVLDRLGFVETGRCSKFCRALQQDMDHVDLVLTRDRFCAVNPQGASAGP